MDKAWIILSAGSGNSSPALGFPFNESAGVLLSRGKPYNDFPAGILFDNANKDQRDTFPITNSKERIQFWFVLREIWELLGGIVLRPLSRRELLSKSTERNRENSLCAMHETSLGFSTPSGPLLPDPAPSPALQQTVNVGEAPAPTRANCSLKPL